MHRNSPPNPWTLGSKNHVPIFDGPGTRTGVFRMLYPDAGPKDKGKRRETSKSTTRTAVNLSLVQILVVVASNAKYSYETYENEEVGKRLHVNSPF